MADSAREQRPLSETLKRAASRALGGGVAGAAEHGSDAFVLAAMTIQVFTLMPLRTTMNYQYRYGMATTAALGKLYGEGGLRRFYRGLAPALLQAPLSRFGDTASNAGALALLGSLESTAGLPAAVKTLGASITAAAFRILLVPVDTVKTIMQVEGPTGLAKLRLKVAAHGPTAMFHGAIATSAATFVGHYPWYAVFNTLQEKVPQAPKDATMQKLSRNAAIGFVSTVISDTISNSLRVIKTYRQTSEVPVSYLTSVRTIVASDGITGLMFRGLKTRILANGLQGVMFSVLWKLFEEQRHARMADRGSSSSKGREEAVGALPGHK